MNEQQHQHRPSPSPEGPPFTASCSPSSRYIAKGHHWENIISHYFISTISHIFVIDARIYTHFNTSREDQLALLRPIQSFKRKIHFNSWWLTLIKEVDRLPIYGTHGTFSPRTWRKQHFKHFCQGRLSLTSISYSSCIK